LASHSLGLAGVTVTGVGREVDKQPSGYNSSTSIAAAFEGVEATTPTETPAYP